MNSALRRPAFPGSGRLVVGRSRSYTIVEAAPGDAGTLADVSIRSYEDAFGEPFHMDREAAVRRWER